MDTRIRWYDNPSISPNYRYERSVRTSLQNMFTKLFSERFNHAKEVLTILIGVLGTVIGFYFGSANDNQASALNASEAVVNNTQPSNGETLMMTNLVTGGRPPYIYAVTFDPVNVVSNAITGTSRDGMIQQNIPISASIETATDVTMQVSVWDSSGQMATVNGTKLLVSP